MNLEDDCCFSVCQFSVKNRTRLIQLISLAITWALASTLLAHWQTFKISGSHSSIIDLPNTVTQLSAHSRFNVSKVALMIEPRPISHLLPQILHMMSILPPDFRFKFIGSHQSVMVVSRNFMTQQHVINGKLDLIVLPKPWEIDNREHVDRLFTDIRFYNEFLSEVEWLLKFTSDSIMCAQSQNSVDEWLEYSWASAVRNKEWSLVSGDLSLRRLSVIKRVLAIYSRTNDTEPEDEWFGKHIGLISKSKIASEIRGVHFSSMKPKNNNSMGYFFREGGSNLADDWQISELRKSTFNYCPELAIIMPMKLTSDGCVSGINQRTIGHKSSHEISFSN